MHNEALGFGRDRIAGLPEDIGKYKTQHYATLLLVLLTCKMADLLPWSWCWIIILQVLKNLLQFFDAVL
ncbi:hypothetical protein ABID22_000829 [Pontibacter aydingkolensis]|uniref:Uncharacterized protein n=1 Tax=Pontibacter aydingkolensis TaxID=1911536 RepID=A0ABS7CSU1_9BACT|nr:hypothetical protein [Pontibacter aydingkolensis]MBW7466919.1 hypothetical protein [Pontibacter aydingkolensis]